MSHKISCYTLFDITQTNIVNRSRPPADGKLEEWLYKRNTQSNFDTVLQAISLRSQPERVSSPQKLMIKFDEFYHFGFLYRQEESILYPCWNFEFEIQHSSVFDNGLTLFGNLYYDCDSIPMIKCGTEWDILSNFLDATAELKNIHFEKLHDPS